MNETHTLPKTDIDDRQGMRRPLSIYPRASGLPRLSRQGGRWKMVLLVSPNTAGPVIIEFSNIE